MADAPKTRRSAVRARAGRRARRGRARRRKARGRYLRVGVVDRERDRRGRMKADITDLRKRGGRAGVIA